MLGEEEEEEPQLSCYTFVAQSTSPNTVRQTKSSLRRARLFRKRVGAWVLTTPSLQQAYIGVRETAKQQTFTMVSKVLFWSGFGKFSSLWQDVRSCDLSRR